MNTSTKVLKVNAGFREVSHFGVTHHMNAENSVAYFRSWQDLDKGTAGGMSGMPMHPGIPMTQEELDTYYPALKENTMLTKSKIGSGKVRFKDLQQPLACMYQGKVYLIAPYAPNDVPALPKSMTKPKLTAEQRKYLDAHKKVDVAGCQQEVEFFQVGIEEAIREGKHLQKQGKRVQIGESAPTGGKPLYTVMVLVGGSSGSMVAPKPTKKPATRSKSGMMGDDSVVIGDHSIVRIGATVTTKQGVGELRGIDTTTYSIPFCSVQLTDEGPHKYEHIYVSAAELTQKKPKTKKPAARKPTPAPNLPPALTAPPELTADILGTGLTPTAAKKPPKYKRGDLVYSFQNKRSKRPIRCVNKATDVNDSHRYKITLEDGDSKWTDEREISKTPIIQRKPAQNLPPALTAPPELTADVFGAGPMGLTPPPATPRRKPATRKPKTKVAAAPKAKPKATKPKAKKTAAAQKLTATQREHLAIQGFVMVKRGGKYVKITG